MSQFFFQDHGCSLSTYKIYFQVTWYESMGEQEWKHVHKLRHTDILEIIAIVKYCEIFLFYSHNKATDQALSMFDNDIPCWFG